MWSEITVMSLITRRGPNWHMYINNILHYTISNLLYKYDETKLNRTFPHTLSDQTRCHVNFEMYNLQWNGYVCSVSGFGQKNQIQLFNELE